MTFQRILFIFSLFLCAVAIMAAYSYRTLVLQPQLATTRTQIITQGEPVESGGDNLAETTTVSQVDLPTPVESDDTLEEREIATAESSDVTESPNVSEGTADLPRNLDADASSQQMIFDDALSAEWQNWSWDTTVDLANVSPLNDGTNSIAVTFDIAWGALWLASYENLYRDDYDVLRFWIHGGDDGGHAIKVGLSDGNQGLLEQSVEISPTINEWQQIDIPLAELDAAEEISGIRWQDESGSNQPPFFIDQVSFVKLSAAGDLAVQNAAMANSAETSASEDYSNVASEITIAIDVQSNRRAISPEIYGINYGDETLVSELGHSIRRWGGNATTRYNWRLDVSNRASDWFFENIAEEVADVASLPNGSSADRFIEQNQASGVKTIMTMPMIGWTPKSRDFACGYPVSKYGAQQSTDQWNPDCGNGKAPNGALIMGDPTDTSIAIDPTFVTEWIGHLVRKFGTAAAGGVTHYNLDNEPMLWNHAHRDVHPEPVSYDELYERTVSYASAIKRADPSAMTLGPALWGWSAYQFSALDLEESGTVLNRYPDRAAHGDMPLIAWYLQQMARYEQQNGVRLLDYLDVHYYPQANGVALAPKGSPQTRELRLRSTRALWDGTYVDESWINEPVRLIPRLREWIDTYYPGTKIALTEYNWGALDDINGALAQAEVLGIFGREGVDLAALWAPEDADDPFTFAFQIYRNYDDMGSTFGDISVQSISSDSEQLSVYSAQRTSDNALTVLIVNKGERDIVTTVDITNFSAASVVQGFRYSEEDKSAIRALPEMMLDGAKVVERFPRHSFTLLVIPQAQ